MRYTWPLCLQGTFSLIIEAWHHNSPATGSSRNNGKSIIFWLFFVFLIFFSCDRLKWIVHQEKGYFCYLVNLLIIGYYYYLEEIVRFIYFSFVRPWTRLGSFCFSHRHQQSLQHSIGLLYVCAGNRKSEKQLDNFLLNACMRRCVS